MSIVLPFEQWGIIEPIVTGEFGNKMPEHPNRASFITQFADGELAGFVHVETLYHFNCIYLAPRFRESRFGAADFARRLMSEAVEKIPEGFSGLWLADRKVDRIAESLGARRLGDYTVYRKDR